MRGAVARLAEAAYERARPGRSSAVARAILLRLAGEGEGEAAVRRRVAARASSTPRATRESWPGWPTTGCSRSARATVEVAHEALLREWPRLRGWLEEDAEGRRLHRHLIARRARLGRRGPRARRALSRRAAGRRARLGRRPRRRAQRRSSASSSPRAAPRRRWRPSAAATSNRRLRALLAGVAVLLVLAVVAGAVALSQRGEARKAALVADAQRLGAQALIDDRLDHALLLARAGVELHDSAATRGSLLSVLQRTPPALGGVRGDGWPLYAVAVSSDDRLMAIGDAHGTVTIYDRATRRPLGRYRIRGGLVQPFMSFSPDGSTLAVPSLDPGNGREGIVDLIDPLTRQRRVRIVPPRFPGKASYIVTYPVFLPNGRDVAIAQLHDAPNPDGPASVIGRYDGRTGAPLGRAIRVGVHSATSLSATADRRRLFMTSPKDDATYMLDAETLRVVRRWPVGDLVGSVSPDGRLFALGVGGRRGPAARPAIRTDPTVPRAPRGSGPADAVHAR